MRSYFIACVFIVTACGGTPKGGGTTTTPPVTTPTLELGEITAFDGPDAMFKIHANGTTEMGGHKGSLELKPGQPASSDSLPIVWEPGPTLHPDGTIDAKGAAVAKVNADGTVVELKTNTVLPIAVVDDRVTITGRTGKSVGAQLGADGKITFINAPDSSKEPQVHIEGADTPGKRRTVLVILGLMFAPADVRTGPIAPTSTEAPAPVDAPKP